MRVHVAILVFLTSLSFYSCLQEEEKDIINFGNLNESGKFFTEKLKTRTNWKEEWHAMQAIGTLSPNQITIAAGGDMGYHCVLPLLNGKEIKGLVIYPLDKIEEGSSVEDAILGEPIFLDQAGIDTTYAARQFIKSASFKSWIADDGLKWNMELQPFAPPLPPPDSINELRSVFPTGTILVYVTYYLTHRYTPSNEVIIYGINADRRFEIFMEALGEYHYYNRGGTEFEIGGVSSMGGYPQYSFELGASNHNSQNIETDAMYLTYTVLRDVYYSYGWECSAAYDIGFAGILEFGNFYGGGSSGGGGGSSGGGGSGGGSNNNDNNSNNYTVTLTGNSQIDLMEPYNLRTTVQPSSLNITSVKFAFTKDGGVNTFYIETGTSLSYNEKAKTPGVWTVYAKVNNKYTSTPVNITVQYPDKAKILANTRSQMDAAWADAKNASGQNEFGYCIFANTETMKYDFDFSNSVSVGCGTLAHLEFDCPYAMHSSPLVGDKYRVASFHTHTTYYDCEWTHYRMPGPSTLDQNFANNFKLPGFVYDWIGGVYLNKEGEREYMIFGGHSSDDPAQIYDYGPDRRTD